MSGICKQVYMNMFFYLIVAHTYNKLLGRLKSKSIRAIKYTFTRTVRSFIFKCFSDKIRTPL